MFVRKNRQGKIVEFSKRAIPTINDELVNGVMKFKTQEGWEKSTDDAALADFLENGPAKTEDQLDNADRSYYSANVDPLVIKAILDNATDLGLDLSEAKSIKNARRAKRNKAPE